MHSRKKLLAFALSSWVALASAFSPTPLGNIAPLGAPSSVRFNGIETIQDTAHRVAAHALRATYFPNGYVPGAEDLPEIGDIKLLARRDSVILYVPNVAGAADYRVRVAGGWRQTQDMRMRIMPRNVWACAGFRQRAWEAKEDANGVAQRELLQAIELPGLTQTGIYAIEVEALAQPCPFTGMPAHTSALIPLAQPRLQGLSGATIPFTGFADAISTYGAEFINGQWSSADVEPTAGQLRGQARAPSAPTRVARSIVLARLPAYDEAVNAPIIDVGPNSVFDDFTSDGIATNFARMAGRSFGGSDAIEGAFGDWFFWGSSAQSAVGQGADAQPLGVQVWQRHGRLNITMADWAQDVFAATHFSSTKSGVQTLDDESYVHSFFRVDSGATERRYWHWMMCGADDANTLIDPNTKVPRVRHLLRPSFYDAGGVNPTSPAFGEANTPFHNRECVQLIQLSTNNPNTPQRADGSNGPLPNQSLLAVLNPEGSSKGVINLTPAVFDRGYGINTINWRLDASDHYAGPIVEPFDQQQPLTHFDMFVRKDRMVLFINGRQAHCWNLSQRPLTMKVSHFVYGQVLYHTDAEVEGYFYPKRTVDTPWRPAMASFHYSLNTVAADHRAWDAIGHGERIAIPALLNFNEALCKAPGSVEVR